MLAAGSGVTAFGIGLAQAGAVLGGICVAMGVLDQNANTVYVALKGFGAVIIGGGVLAGVGLALQGAGLLLAIGSGIITLGAICLALAAARRLYRQSGNEELAQAVQQATAKLKSEVEHHGLDPDAVPVILLNLEQKERR